METVDRAAIGNLIKISSGSMRAVARLAGIDQTALKRWISGQSTVSSSKLIGLYGALGLMPGEPLQANPAGVHVWQPKKMFSELEFDSALRFFFTDPPEAAEAPWSRLGKERAKKLLRLNMETELYAFFDGCTMLVFRPGPGPWINLEKLHCKRRGGTVESSTLDAQAVRLLLKERPSLDDFLLAWFGQPEAVARHLNASTTASQDGLRGKKPKGLRDLDNEVKQRGLSYDQAIMAIREWVKG